MGAFDYPSLFLLTPVVSSSVSCMIQSPFGFQIWHCFFVLRSMPNLLPYTQSYNKVEYQTLMAVYATDQLTDVYVYSNSSEISAGMKRFEIPSGNRIPVCASLPQDSQLYLISWLRPTWSSSASFR